VRTRLQTFFLVSFVSLIGCSRSEDRIGSDNGLAGSQPWTVRSADGTSIGYTRIGDGPSPLVIVHGVLDSSESWVGVAEALSEQCSCFVMDRRGRGRSGDSDSYTFENEIEDIEAVLRVAGSDAFLLGHSSGAIYTLEAARRVPVAGLILYEPPLHYEGFDAVVDRIRNLVSEGKLAEAAEVFIEGPATPQIAELAPTLVREWDAIFTFGPNVARYQDLSMPTLLLAGSDTLSEPTFATVDFAGSLSDVRTAILDGQGHTANVSVPELVANRVAEFLQQVAE